MKELNKVVFLHTPKTGGGAMCDFFNKAFDRKRNFFLSFFGKDHSFQYNDERSTTGGNSCIIEKLFIDPTIVKKFHQSPHFKEAKLLLGHTTYSFGKKFPEYNFEYMMIVRDPIERTISNIQQFAPVGPGPKGKIFFAGKPVDAKQCSDEYWEIIYRIMTDAYPIPGFCIHENLFLRNIMTRMIAGGEFRSFDEKPNLEKALENKEKIHISFYNDFNRGLQKSFDQLNIRIDMSRNLKANKGTPNVGLLKEKTGKYYNAPQKMIDLVTELNQDDIALYEVLLKDRT